VLNDKAKFFFQILVFINTGKANIYFLTDQYFLYFCLPLIFYLYAFNCIIINSKFDNYKFCPSSTLTYVI